MPDIEAMEANVLACLDDVPHPQIIRYIIKFLSPSKS